MEHLDYDALVEVLSVTSPTTLVAASRVCSRLHRIAKDDLGLVSLDLAASMNQTELCKALGMTPAQAQQLPFTVKERRNGSFRYTTHIYDTPKVVDTLVAKEGWAGLAARVQKVMSNKRKRDDLGERRLEAAAKRKATLEAWFAKSRPFGYSSLGAWLDAVKHDPVPEAASFLSSAQLKAPSFASVKAAISAHEVAVQAKNVRASELKDALAAMGLERRKDSRLCEEYETSGPFEEFQSVEAVVKAMAFAKWTRECIPNFNHEVEKQKEWLTVSS